jgi:hypothetical protein
VANKKHVVKLSDEERERLGALISKGKAAARTILKARILLKADASQAGGGWTDEKIREALDTNICIMMRVRAWCEASSLSALRARTRRSGSGRSPWKSRIYAELGHAGGAGLFHRRLASPRRNCP